jgi:hypothetical protein
MPTQVDTLTIRTQNTSNLRLDWILIQDGITTGGGGTGTFVESVNSGDGINVDNTDPQNPIVHATGLEALNEGSGTGHRIIGRNAANFGNIGLNAVDFSISSGASSTRGATGTGSVSFGRNVINPYQYTLMFGWDVTGTTTNTLHGFNILGGETTTYYNGIYNSISTGFNSEIGTAGAALADAVIYQSIHAGQWNKFYASRDGIMVGSGLDQANNLTAEFNAYGPRMVVGTGVINSIETGPYAGAATRRNGFVVMSDGVVSAPELSIPKIDTPTVPLLASGTTDGTTASKLVDSTADFTLNKNIRIGDIVNNTTDVTTALITAIDDANTLSLDADIFISGENYEIEPQGFEDRVLITKEYADQSYGNLIKIDEGNGDGYILKGRDAANYGNVGLRATDLSYSSGPSSTYGATGQQSFAVGQNIIADQFASVAMGYNNSSLSAYSFTVGSVNTVYASSNWSIAMGFSNEVTGEQSVAIGTDNHLVSDNDNYAFGKDNTTSGTLLSGMRMLLGDGNSFSNNNTTGVLIGLNNSQTAGQGFALGAANIGTGSNNILIGSSLDGFASYEVVLGRFNTNYVANDAVGWDTADRILTVGIGTGVGLEADALRIIKDGRVELPSGHLEVLNAAFDSKLYYYGLEFGEFGTDDEYSSYGYQSLLIAKTSTEDQVSVTSSAVSVQGEGVGANDVTTVNILKDKIQWDDDTFGSLNQGGTYLFPNFLDNTIERTLTVSETDWFRILDSADTTKEVDWNLTALTTATTRTVTMPDANVDLSDVNDLPVANLADGTDGELITWDAAGAPTTVPVGTSGQVLTSAGAGAVPTWETKVHGAENVFTVKVALSAAQVKALNTTPITAIAAQGAGTFINVLNTAARLTWGTVAFDDNAIQITTSGASGVLLSTSSFLNSTANNLKSFGRTSPSDNDLAENTAIEITAQADSVATGDSTVDVYITYEVITL